ncbi:hypothetical protein [Streptomyces silvisoli]|uniref:Uncharacterized protein n=1 Tax=Streptomyces silvisoli TaxID=3034235 RepID=A0ABT5ZLP2_9ACTN|nr:hypothetical protein [Streptomyces silvisoli]MDF3290744.1 hypothetical protein [Streptomyces silvisoli]
MDLIPAAVRDALSDDELQARLEHAAHLNAAGAKLPDLRDAQGYFDLAHQVLTAMPAAELRRKVRAINRTADGMTTPNEASAHRSAAFRLAADNPQPPGYEVDSTSSQEAKPQASTTAKRAPASDSNGGMIYKGAPVVDIVKATVSQAVAQQKRRINALQDEIARVRNVPIPGAPVPVNAHESAQQSSPPPRESSNAAWYKREFARLDLEEKAASYKQMSDSLIYTDRELAATYKQMAAEAHEKLQRGDY